MPFIIAIKEAKKRDTDEEVNIYTPKAIKQNAKLIREQILEKVMVRGHEKEYANITKMILKTGVKISR
jgi:hypothetical protein